MTFEEFQYLARLYVVGALDDDEMSQFRNGRKQFGRRAEEFINECRKLNAAFALSLQPQQPHPDTKEKLLTRIREAAIQQNSSPRMEMEQRNAIPLPRYATLRRGGMSRI